MSYQERRAIVSLFGSTLTFLLYCAYMLTRYPEVDAYSAEMFHFWGSFFLILIPVSIIAKVIIQIIFVIINAIITREDDPEIMDERDKLIELKAMRNALYAFTFGFLVAMASLVFDMTPPVMFAIFVCSGFLAGAVSDISEFYFYRRGV
ncbi:MAG: DUF2178 domain-containing protein [Anaerolineaceae bacterium]|nr:MAG: DUF2178 domain-containing protein [Anaerolineaceae bacterium]